MPPRRLRGGGRIGFLIPQNAERTDQGFQELLNRLLLNSVEVGTRQPLAFVWIAIHATRTRECRLARDQSPCLSPLTCVETREKRVGLLGLIPPDIAPVVCLVLDLPLPLVLARDGVAVEDRPADGDPHDGGRRRGSVVCRPVRTHSNG